MRQLRNWHFDCRPFVECAICGDDVRGREPTAAERKAGIDPALDTVMAELVARLPALGWVTLKPRKGPHEGMAIDVCPACAKDFVRISGDEDKKP